MRRGELLALKWQDINLATRTLQVRRILTHMPAKLNGKGGYVEAEPRAEEVGFEPTKAIHLTRFPVVLTRPL